MHNDEDRATIFDLFLIFSRKEKQIQTARQLLP